MKLSTNQRSRLLRVAGVLVMSFLACASSAKVSAAPWNGIEPFKSRRADVVQILGQPISESPDGVLRFSVSGGSVQVSFVDQKFVTTKKLRTELAGTVLEIVLQHEHSSDTPESLNLLKTRGFVRDEVRNLSTFRSIKEGIVYTFIDGKLKTTRYTFSDRELGRARQ